MPYGIEETNNELISEIANNLLDTKIILEENNKQRRKNLERLIKILEILKQRELDNPFFSNIIKKIDSLLSLIKSLSEIYTNYRRDAAKLVGIDKSILITINGELRLIMKKIQDWLGYIKPKIEEVARGNKHLEYLPLHPTNTRFYAKIKELNPDYTLELKHPINEKQAAIQVKRSNEELLKLDKKDPITGGRAFRKGDDFAYAGSKVIVTQGHHRLYELYRRYLESRISGEALVEIMIDEKLIQKR